jgi:AcrR family transcriptional regulator
MPKKIDRKEKAEAIGLAAMRVFRKLGYHQTRMADIADAAGVGKGTLYEYFRSKGAILSYELDRYFSVFKSGSFQVLAQATSPGEKLLALTDFALAHTSEWEDYCAVYIDCLGAPSESQDGLLSMSDIYGEMREQIKLLVEQGQDSGEIKRDHDVGATAELLLSMYDGLVLNAVLEEHSFDKEALRREAIRFVAYGLMTEPSQFLKDNDNENGSET